MNTKELVEYLSTNEFGDDANDLLYCLDPKLEIQFHAACKKLDKIISKIKKTYPDAHYLCGDDIIQLMLGFQNTEHRPIQVELDGEMHLVGEIYYTHNHGVYATSSFVSSVCGN